MLAAVDITPLPVFWFWLLRTARNKPQLFTHDDLQKCKHRLLKEGTKYRKLGWWHFRPQHAICLNVAVPIQYIGGTCDNT